MPNDNFDGSIGRLRDAVARRFGETLEEDLTKFGQAIGDGVELDAAARFAARGSCREFMNLPLSREVLKTLSILAMCAPSKSDLQQADIVIVESAEKRRCIADLVPSMPWVADAPGLLVVCANNRRQRQCAVLRGHPFANDHLDAFFNASVDAGVVLATLVFVAETIGLGCCPVSVLRNRSKAVSDLLELPDYVFAVAGLAVGWPVTPPKISPRLDPTTTVHFDRFQETENAIASYDQRRLEQLPYAKKRRPDLFAEVAEYSWSEDKARQYALPERSDFGSFVRGKGFKLD